MWSFFLDHVIILLGSCDHSPWIMWSHSLDHVIMDHVIKSPGRVITPQVMWSLPRSCDHYLDHVIYLFYRMPIWLQRSISSSMQGWRESSGVGRKLSWRGHWDRSVVYENSNVHCSRFFWTTHTTHPHTCTTLTTHPHTCTTLTHTKVNLYDARRCRSKALSGGMRRRLSVAMATIGNPDILILDEPTTGLDPASRRQVWEVIETVKEGRSMVRSRWVWRRLVSQGSS